MLVADPKRPQLAQRRAFHSHKAGHLRDIAVETLQLRSHVARFKGFLRLAKRQSQQRINIRIAGGRRDVLNFRWQQVEPRGCESVGAMMTMFSIVFSICRTLPGQ